ncbi:MAG: FAD-dependent oxidoreductase [Desulfovibrio sp.]|uniref:FAD-dependent oxidoreductase n=1 Tax=Desulfovibrio sp. 7SRBS1 TaxID=3378064 RepID=UPI003B409D61
MSKQVVIPGREKGDRVPSRIIEERVQQAFRDGARDITVEACGQHGIGGRLFDKEGGPVRVTITGSSGQRTGSMGYPGTTVDIKGPASDDIGWLNAGADIIVHGNASNGAANAIAQGRVFIGGSIGARGMTMTKSNPRFDPPQLWVLGGTGDYFAEFMAGGTAVICGVDPVDPENVLGYRPCVGMVGGKIYFRGPIEGFSQADAKLVPIDDASWEWLTTNMKEFLSYIERPELLDTLSVREEWQCIETRTPHEKASRPRRSMTAFRAEVWDAELGRGGIIGDLTDLNRSPIPLIVTGEMRRFVPVWEHDLYQAPCQANCPTGIPVQKRWELVREGNVDEAVDMALAYTPFPATVCGYLCPNLCMQACTKTISAAMPAIDITKLGKESIKGKMPDLPELSGGKVAVIGGGPAGISAAWQLRMMGHEAIVYDMEKVLGGKISSSIPEHRIPKDVLDSELERIRKVLPHVYMQQKMDKDEFARIVGDHDFVILATGAQRPRNLPIPGNERITPALTFLKKAKQGDGSCGKRVVIIGAGNVGCDVASEAARLGAEDITLIDIQEPASFGKERDEAVRIGAKFRYPCFTKEITEEGVMLTSGEVIPADTVVVSIGDAPDLDYLPDSIAVERGHVKVNELQQTTNSNVFAIGDIARPGLITQAIGAGRTAAKTIDGILRGTRPQSDTSRMIEYKRMTLEYFDPRGSELDDIEHCANECSSCGSCRDCGLCDSICPRGAISRVTKDDGGFQRISDPNKCIGCGFCADTCPCGVWTMVENTPVG